MRALPRVLQVLGINSVPVLGVLVGGWSTATALLLYWFENLFSSLLVGLRIARHRRLTRKRGHWEAPIGSSAARRVTPRSVQSPTGGSAFLTGFLLPAIVFTIAHGLFLAMIIFLILPESYPEAAIIDRRALWYGLLAVTGFLLVGLAIDLGGLRRRPFLWIKRMADRVLGRVIVVHLTIVLGMWTVAFLGGPRGLFLVFAAFKTLADISTLAATSTPSPEAPRWLVGIVRRLGGATNAVDFERFYREAHREELENQARWEEIRSSRSGDDRR